MFPERSLRSLAEELPFKDEAFDFAYSTKAVGWYPHSINLEMAVREMSRAVKKKIGVTAFNIGGEMKSEIINSVIKILSREGYGINVVNNNWVTCGIQNTKKTKTKC